MDALPRRSLKARADISASIALARFFIVTVSWSRVAQITTQKAKTSLVLPTSPYLLPNTIVTTKIRHKAANRQKKKQYTKIVDIRGSIFFSKGV